MAEGTIESNVKVRLTHETAMEVLTSGNADVWVTVILARKNGDDLPGRMIEFYLDGSTYPVAEESTNEKGRASVALHSLPSGRHVVTARVADSWWYETVSIAIPAPKLGKRKPANLRVSFSGERGRQKLLMLVDDEDGMRMNGFVVQILDGDNFVNHTTDELYQMDFSEPRRLVRVIAGNAKNLRWDGVLVGPVN